jgi:hypothetical protein
VPTKTLKPHISPPRRRTHQGVESTAAAVKTL